jgi:hypothetical protein
MSTICITSYTSVGCTFIDWSIHYLSGQDRYYNAELGWVDLSHNPITKINAHGHQKNHPAGYNKAKHYVEKFKTLPSDSIYSFYPCTLRFDVAAKELGTSIDQFCNNSTFSKVLEFTNNDHNKIFDLCYENQVKLVFVGQDKRVALYHQAVRTLDHFNFKPGKPQNEQEALDELQEIFFSDSINTWKELNLTDVWDIRERLALDIRPLNSISNYKFNFAQPHLHINCLDLWTRTESVVYKIMDYLKLDIDNARKQSWIHVCNEWQKTQLDLLDFVYKQPHIVEAIVNNWYYEIDLTFQQEVLIQHYLIYQHGLNLKTWKLSKFPNNTQELHKLLEPNIHQVPKIY